MAEVQDLDSEIEAVEAKETPPAVEVPEKYRNKAIEDVVKMHQEAEKLIDRQAKEVGEVRRLADELLRSQLQPKPVVVEEKPEVDFFADPQEAVRQAVDRHPKVVAAEQYALQANRMAAAQKLQQMHPDFTQVVQDVEFSNWVKSSKIRSQLYQQAEAYDVDAADELLSTFKQLNAKRTQQVTEADTQARSKALKSASVDTGGSGESGKKVYRRADLIQLKLRDPAAYAARQEEIDLAYQEGRIR
jgi:hypothetical protein